MNCPYKVKVCTKCKRILIACEMNFSKSKGGKYGYRGDCKQCCSQYYKKNKEHYKQYRIDNKEQITEYKKHYYEENKGNIIRKNKQYRNEHQEETQIRSRNYREKNKEQIKEYNKQYYEENPHIRFNNNIKRRQLEENQGNGITKEQWLEMMNYFNWECAYSGIQLNKNNRSVDHIVPLNNKGLNEIWNCIPMYKSYNTSKHTKDMEQWYRQQEYFNEERLEKIYQWIEYAYEKWGKEE